LDNLAGYLRECREASANVGAKLLVVSIPFGAYVNKEAYVNYVATGFEADPTLPTSSRPDAAFEQVCKRLELPLLTNTDVFRAHGDDPKLFFKYDLHLAATGQALLAEQVAPFLAAHIHD
jgi:hypothetical protein